MSWAFAENPLIPMSLNAFALALAPLLPSNLGMKIASLYTILAILCQTGLGICDEKSPIISSVYSTNNSPSAIAAAEERGKQAAQKDIQEGQLRILYFGLTTDLSLDQETGFRLQILAGCQVSSEFVAETTAYNEAMIRWHKKTLKTGATNMLDAVKVLAIARETVAKNDTWIEKSEFGAPQRREDGSWAVMVWRLPKTTGGHRLAIIDKDGKAIDYIRGE
jgi:hypothetical protein